MYHITLKKILIVLRLTNKLKKNFVSVTDRAILYFFISI